MSEQKEGIVNVLHSIPSYNARYKQLMSKEFLTEAGLCPPSGASFLDVEGNIHDDAGDDVDDDAGDDLDDDAGDDEVVVVNEQTLSPSRRNESRGKVHGTVPRRGTPLSPKFSTSLRGEERGHPPAPEDNVGMTGDGSSQWFVPPYPLDPNHSYYNDPELAYKLDANIVTPADDEVIKGLGWERWRSQVSVYGAKVMFLHAVEVLFLVSFLISYFIRCRLLNFSSALLLLWMRSWINSVMK